MHRGRSKKYLLIFLSAALFLVCHSVSGAVWETLTPDHWAYDEIRWLQALGYLHNLDPSQKPYTRGEVANALKTSTRPDSKPAADIFEILDQEFAFEMKPGGAWEFTAGGRVYAGTETRQNDDWNSAGYGVVSATAGNARMGIVTSLRLDRDLMDHPFYKGKVWNDFAGLTEQAYFVLCGANRRWELKLGRDHRYWGAGDDHLLLNYAQRGIDQISFRVRWEWGDFTAMVGQVDDFEEADGGRISRYLSGHRLELLPWDWLRIGISETLLFTGGVRFGSMNPFLPYYGELVNENSEGNGFIGLDFIAYPAGGYEVYGELLIDDFQLENEDPGDLEPTEWGWLIGGRWNGLNGLLGAGVSYTGVANRTYNALDPKYRYLNYGLPLGSEIGNDGDRFRFELSCLPEARLRLSAFFQYARQGEGGVAVPFDTTYMNYTVAEGYAESFPTGVVQKTSTFGVEFSGLAKPYLQIQGWIGYDWIDNYGHTSGLKEEGIRGRVTLNLRGDRLIKY